MGPVDGGLESNGRPSHASELCHLHFLVPHQNRIALSFFVLQ
jgi:hypothetical protein